MKKIWGIFCGILCLAACSSDKIEIADMPAEDLYNLAWEDLEKTK